MPYEVRRERVGTVLLNTAQGRSVFFQPGDDEAAFWTYYEPIEARHGAPIAAAIAWTDYGHLATEEAA